MSNNFQQSEIQTQADDEISLIDILRFLKGAYKSILITGLVGLGVAVAYLVVTPKQYVAIAQIAMAQIGASNNNLNPLGVNIEEPTLLITRLSSPTTFTSQVLGSCGVNESAYPGVTLVKSIKLAPLKGVASVVELKAIGTSPEVASTCAQAIFELVKVTQAQIIAPYIEEAKIKLADDEGRLIKAKDLISKADRSGQAVGAAYLSTRDEIRYLLDEIASLRNVVITNQSRVTRLITPIYVSETPIAPPKRIVLIAGLLGGLFLGLLIALVRQMVAKCKSEAGGGCDVEPSTG